MSKEKICLVDLQCFVSASAYRGVGRYSYNLLKNLIKNDNSIKFLGFLPAIDYSSFLKSPASRLFTRNHLILFEREEVTSLNFQEVNLQNRFLLFQAIKCLKFDFLLQLSPLAEPANSWVSPDFLYDSVPTYSIFYDAIFPSRQNSHDEFQYQQFLKRIEHLKNVDGFLSISNKSDVELRELLGKEVNSVVVGGGPTLGEDSFGDFESSGETFFFPGAGDPRKGAEILIEAVRQIDEDIPANTRFVLSGTTTEFGTKIWELVRAYNLEKYFIFLGTLTEQELFAHYVSAIAIIFPSRNEGLGLPVLDAQSVGKPCLIARSPELQEIGFDSEFSFEVDNPIDLGNQIKNFLFNATFRSERVRIAAESSKLTKDLWPRAARISLEFCEDHLRIRGGAKKFEVASELVFITPLPPEATGIADYNQSLLASLSDKIDISANHDIAALVDVLVSNNVILALGNSPHHYPAFSFIPFCNPVFDVHDASLDRFYETLPYGELRTSLPKYILAEFGIQALYEMPAIDKIGVPLGTKLLQNLVLKSRCTITHNLQSAKLVKSHQTIPLWWRSNVGRESIKKTSGDEITISTFGFLDESKQIHSIITSLGSSDFREDIHLTVVGTGSPNYTSRLRELAIENKVKTTFTGYVDKDRYFELINSTDIAIQLRNSQRAESPGSVIDCLEFGIPTVSNSEIAKYYYGESDNFYFVSDTNDLTNLVDQIIEFRLFSDENLVGASLPLSLSVSAAAETYFQVLHDPSFRGLSLTKEKQLEVKKLFMYLSKKNYFLQEISKIRAHQYRPKVYVVLTDEVKKVSIDGILRVAKTFYSEFIQDFDYPIIPVVRSGDKFILANDLGLLDTQYQEFFRNFDLEGFPIEPTKDDIVLFPGLDAGLTEAIGKVISWRETGTRIITIIHDVLPLTNPELFLDWFPKSFHIWLENTIKMSSDLVFDSHVSLDSWGNLIHSQVNKEISKVVIRPFLEKFSVPAIQKSEVTTFILAGTIEPRKGHSLVLDEFEKIWLLGVKVHLRIVGKIGWYSENILQRIEALIADGQEISFAESPSDSEFKRLLVSSHFAICASSHEGYCLPGLEAHALGLSVIARNTPIYREVLGNFAYFFDSDPTKTKTSLSDVVIDIVKGIGEKHIISKNSFDNVESNRQTETTWREFLKSPL